jgi:hypothetical protein
MVACAPRGHWPNIIKLGLVAVGCLGTAVVAAIVLVRTFRAEARAVDAQRERYRDNDAPPWERQ